MSTSVVASVVTPETLAQQLIPLVKIALAGYTGGGANAKHGLSFATVVLIAMEAVEKYSDTIAKLAGPDKLQAAKLLVPLVLSLAVQEGALEQARADVLTAQLGTGLDVVGQLVEAYVILSKNPRVIQAVEAMEAAVSGCVARCKARKTAAPKV